MKKPFVLGLIAGSALTAATLVGYAYGAGTRTSSDVGVEAAPKLATSCQIQVGFGQLTGGTQCFNNQVMIGTAGGDLLCADLTATCN